MPPELSDGPLALLYAILVLSWATIFVPDPTGALGLPVGFAGLALVGYALLDDSLRELRWGVVALYAVGIAVALLEWLARDALLERGLYEYVLPGTAILAVCGLFGTYLLVRRRGAPAGLPPASRRS